MCYFEFFIDMTQHFDDNDVKLQCKGQFNYNLYDKTQDFEMFKAEKTTISMKMFSSPFNIDVDTVYIFFSVNIEFFYKSYVMPGKFQLLTTNANK